MVAMKTYIKILVLITTSIMLLMADANATSTTVYLKEGAHTLPTNDSLIIKLKAINLSSYHGRVVDSLIAHLPSGIVDYQIGGWHDLRTADVMFLKYNNDVFVSVFVKTWSHMDPHLINAPTSQQNWIPALFRMETLPTRLSSTAAPVSMAVKMNIGNQGTLQTVCVSILLCGDNS
jgi:hypothetical protein